MEAIDPIPSSSYPTLTVDPKDEKIEILLAYIKDLQGMVEFLKGLLKNQPVRGIEPIQAPRPKFNSTSEIKNALEAHTRMKAERLRLEAESQKEEKSA